MRQLDENKRKKIIDAAVKLIVTQGFAATSMHKIAKEANVAASTIYLYFENKEDMLNNVYLKVKRDYIDAVLKNFDSSGDIKNCLKTCYDNSCDFLEKHPLESSFMDQFENSALISKIIREQTFNQLLPLSSLLDRGIKENVLKNTNPMIIATFLIYPITLMIRGSQRDGGSIDKEIKDLMFDMAWEAVKA